MPEITGLFNIWATPEVAFQSEFTCSALDTANPKSSKTLDKFTWCLSFSVVFINYIKHELFAGIPDKI